MISKRAQLYIIIGIAVCITVLGLILSKDNQDSIEYVKLPRATHLGTLRSKSLIQSTNITTMVVLVTIQKPFGTTNVLATYVESPTNIYRIGDTVVLEQIGDNIPQIIKSLGQ